MPTAESTIPAHGLTPNEVAKLLRKSPDWVRARIRAGELGALNLAASKLAKPQFVILPAHLEAFFQARAATTEAKPVPKRAKRKPGAIDFFPGD